ncbi:MAG: hypothetical protein WCO26_23700 [Deltaproteobacteria bacterium]
MNTATSTITNVYTPPEVCYSLTRSEQMAEEAVLSWLYASSYVGICFADKLVSVSISHTVRNSVEDRLIRWAEIGRAIDRLRPAKRTFLFLVYREQAPWLIVCRRCHIRPDDWHGYRRTVLHLLARWMGL